MIDLTKWLNDFTQKLKSTFGNRVWFVGLQGSYGRGEATEESDLDLVVILDELTAQDIAAYSAMLDTIPHREMLCGFLSGRKELLNWETSDLFQFYHDTLPVKGSLDALLPLIDEAAILRAIKLGACNIYHGCVHNMLYEKSEDILRGLYKSASFIVQAICYHQTGNYIRKQQDLLNSVTADDRRIVETFLDLKHGRKMHFQEMSELLFHWSKKWIAE